MKLLQEITEELEYVVEEAEVVTEGVEPKKSHYLSGIFLQSDTKNKNGRIYPSEMLRKEIQRYDENYIQGKRSYGELNHPTEPSINLDKVSHIITSLKEDGNNWMGRAKILEHTPNGRIVKALLDEGCKLGVSSRGLGSLKEKNGIKIVESLMLTTAADIVADPSVAVALTDHVMEAPEWFFNGIDWVQQEKAYEIVQEHKTFTREQREARFLQMFDQFVKTMNG